MRIRKNAKLSPLLFSSMASVPRALQTHVCQLNQSPWDVIPFQQDAASQLEDAEYSFTGDASLGDSSIGAVESVASMMEESAKLSNNIVIINESEVMAEKDGDFGDENGDGFEKLVAGDDDCSWKCKKQPKEEDYSSFSSDHHHRRSFLRSSENNNYSSLDNYSISKKAEAGTAAAASRRTRPARASKKAGSAAENPYEFYYYSGFGPLWGKKRREIRGGEEGARSVENTTGIRSNATTPSPPPSEIYGDELDYVDDDEEEEEEDGGDGGKKRMRKPVKARSLKSLM